MPAVEHYLRSNPDGDDLGAPPEVIVAFDDIGRQVCVECWQEIEAGQGYSCDGCFVLIHDNCTRMQQTKGKFAYVTCTSCHYGDD